MSSFKSSKSHGASEWDECAPSYKLQSRIEQQYFAPTDNMLQIYQAVTNLLIQFKNHCQSYNLSWRLWLQIVFKGP